MAIDQSAISDALVRLEADGSDLKKPLDMDFFVAAPSESAGLKVASEAAALGFLTSVEKDEESSEWTCYCGKRIVPTLANVVAIEEQLDAIGRAHGGYGDGFGSFGNGSVSAG